MSRTLLLDADLICWRAAAAAPDIDQAALRVERLVDGLKRRLLAERAVYAFSHTDNWRRALLPSYKAARRGRVKPAALAGLRARLEAREDARAAPGLEADDVLGLLATGVAVGGAAPPLGEGVVVSADKDLASVPGLLCADLVGAGLRRVSPAEAARAHLSQTLTGDAADGYQGCPGVGVKTAAAFLRAPYLARRGRSGRIERSPAPDLWSGVVSLFELAGLDAAAALTQARVARILRAGEYDVARAEPRFWRPAQLSQLDL